MSKKQSQNYSGVRICDSIVMSVKKKNISLRKLEALLIAILGYVSTIMVFLTMMDFDYKRMPFIVSACIFSLIYIILSHTGKKTIWLILGSIGIIGTVFLRKIDSIALGYKYV